MLVRAAGSASAGFSSPSAVGGGALSVRYVRAVPASYWVCALIFAFATTCTACPPIFGHDGEDQPEISVEGERAGAGEHGVDELPVTPHVHHQLARCEPVRHQPAESDSIGDDPRCRDDVTIRRAEIPDPTTFPRSAPSGSVGRCRHRWSEHPDRDHLRGDRGHQLQRGSVGSRVGAAGCPADVVVVGPQLERPHHEKARDRGVACRESRRVGWPGQACRRRARECARWR